MCTANKRIEQIKQETKELRKEVQDLKATLLQQNEIIISLLSKQTSILNETAARASPQALLSKKISEFSRRFPLENVQDLEKFESDINTENENHVISIVQAHLAPKGLTKSISNVLSEKIVMDVNVDGYHKKKRLLDFPKTLDILFQASRKDKDNYNSQTFLDDLRKALRMVKNRIHKNNCQARHKLREQAEQQKAAQKNISHFVIKTEKDDFD